MNSKFYVYDQKALDNGARQDRVFMVANSASAGDRPLVWPCSVEVDGLMHPAYLEPLAMFQVERGEGREPVIGDHRASPLTGTTTLLEVDFDYVKSMFRGRMQVEAEASPGESRGLRFHRGLKSMAEFKRHFPDSAGGLKVVAVNPAALDDHEIVLFEGNIDSCALAVFVKQYAYVNSWTITIVPFDAV